MIPIAPYTLYLVLAFWFQDSGSGSLQITLSGAVIITLADRAWERWQKRKNKPDGDNPDLKGIINRQNALTERQNTLLERLVTLAEAQERRQNVEDAIRKVELGRAAGAGHD